MSIAKTRYISEYEIDTRRATGPAQKLDAQLVKGQASAKGFGSSLMAIGAGAAGLWLAHKAMSAIGDSLRAWGVQEKAIKQVEAAIESTGGVAGLTLEEVEALASGLQDLTLFGDEVTLMAAAQLLTFKEIKEDIFPGVLELAQDLSTRFGQDLKSSVILLGKALNDPITGLTALRRIGIELEEEQADLAKRLAETGDIAGAQALIMAEVAAQVGGSARAAREGVGAFTALENTAGDLSEELGKRLAGALTGVATGLESVLSSTISWLNRGDDLAALLDELAPRAEKVAQRFGNLAEAVERSAKHQRALDNYTLLTARLAEFDEVILSTGRQLSDAFLEDAARVREAHQAAAQALRQVIAETAEEGRTHKTAAEEVGEHASAEDLLRAALARTVAGIEEAEARIAAINEARRERLRLAREEAETLAQGEALIEAAPLPFGDVGDLAPAVEEAAAAGGEVLAEAIIPAGEQVGSFWGREITIAGEGVGVTWGEVLRSAIVALSRVAQDWGRRDRGQFGGRISGNFEDEGAAAGAVIGGIVGSFIPVVGTAIGALVGEFLGGVIGGAIKQGADEGLAQLNQIGDEVVASIQADEGGLGWVVAEVALGVKAAIDQFEALLGGEINIDPGGGGGLKIKLRDEEIRTWFAGQLVGVFDNIQDAIDATIAAVIRDSEIGAGTSPEVEAALRNFTGSTLEQLTSVLELALRQEAGRIGPIAAAIEKDVGAIAAELFGALAAGMTGEGSLADLGRLKDEILGIQLSEEEKLRRRAEAFNLEIALLEAALLAQLAKLEADGQILRASAKITEAHIDVQGEWIRGLGTMVGATGAAAAAIASIAAALAQLADARITAEELAAAAGRLGRSGRGGGSSGRAAARQAERERREAALLELRTLKALAAGRFDLVEQYEREARILQLVAAGLTELEAAQQAALEAELRHRGILQDLALLEAQVAGDDAELEQLRREIALQELLAQGYSEAEALRRLELEAALEAAAAAAAAAEEWARQLEEIEGNVAGLFEGPAGLLGGFEDLISRFAEVQGQIEGALAQAISEGRFEDVAGLLAQLDALDTELTRQLEAFGQDALDAFGGPFRRLRAETRQTAADIRFLLSHLEELGITAREVAQAVAESIIPDLLAIGEAQARRVGDEEALARLTAQRQRLELLFERIRFESMVATLRVAGALDAELMRLVLEVRRLFLLPTAPGQAAGAGPRPPTSSEVDSLARFREELEGILSASARGRLGPARQALERIFDTFARAGEILRTLDASGSDWIETARAMAGELADFWQNLVTDPAQERLDRIRAARQTPAQQFLAARGAFEGLFGRGGQAGSIGSLDDLAGIDFSALDPDQIAEIFEVLDAYQAAGTAQFGESFGSTIVGRQVEALLEQLIGAVPDEEDLLLLALQHLEEQQALQHGDTITALGGISGPIVGALTLDADSLAAELRLLASEIDDEAIANGLEDLATALENGEIGLDDASLLAALDAMRDGLDEGSPLWLQLSGLIDQLAAGVAVDTGTLAGSLEGLGDIIGDGNAEASALLASIAEQLLNGTLEIGDQALLDQLAGVLGALGPEHPLHDVLETIWSTLGGAGAPSDGPNYPAASHARLGAIATDTGAISAHLDPEIHSSAGWHMKRVDQLLETDGLFQIRQELMKVSGDQREQYLLEIRNALAAPAGFTGGVPADPVEVAMRELWGPGSKALGHLSAIEGHLATLAADRNLTAGSFSR